LQLARACDREQALDGAFTFIAAGAKHDFPPLNGGPQRALGGGMPRAGLCRVRQLSLDRIGARRAADAA
jgi:hypothetical protein